MCCSVILPCLCYLLLHGSAQSSVLMQLAVVCMMATGAAVLFAVVFANFV